MKAELVDSEILARSQRTLQHNAKSFRWAQLFLNEAERNDSAVAYAFCRWVDDTVDETEDLIQARRNLDEISAMLEGSLPAEPLLTAYRTLSERRGFGLNPARNLLLGAASDLDTVRLADDAALGTYCYRVAGTVGLMMCGILGVTDPKARRHAVDLGVAMQLTNICRDVREDAERGRVYLPESRLSRHGLSSRDLLTPGLLDQDEARRSGLVAVTRELLALADAAYASGEKGLVYLPLRARLAIAVASRIYGGIGRRLARVQAADPWQGRVRVPTHEKLWLACVALGTWVRASIRSQPSGDRGEPLVLPLPSAES